MTEGLNILGASEKELIVMVLQKLEKIEGQLRMIGHSGGGGSGSYINPPKGSGGSPKPAIQDTPLVFADIKGSNARSKAK